MVISDRWESLREMIKMDKYLERLENVIDYAKDELLNSKHIIKHYEVNGYTKEIIIKLTKINRYDKVESWKLIFKLNSKKPRLMKLQSWSKTYEKQSLLQGIKDLQA